MAQVLTAAIILAMSDCWGGLSAYRLSERRRQTGNSAWREAFERQPAPGFLHGAADLTFGVVILGLGFLRLLWVIASGQCTVTDGGAIGGAITRVIIASSRALSISNGPAIAAPSVISIAITTPPSS